MKRRTNQIPRDAPLVLGHLDRRTPMVKIDYSAAAPQLYLATEAGEVLITESGSILRG